MARVPREVHRCSGPCDRGFLTAVALNGGRVMYGQTSGDTTPSPHVNPQASVPMNADLGLESGSSFDRRQATERYESALELTGDREISSETSSTDLAMAIRIACRAGGRRDDLFRRSRSRMELHEPRWIDAAHSSSGNDPSPGQMLSGVGHAAHVLAGGIKGVGVNVESTIARARKNEVAFARVVAGPLMESASRHQVASKRHPRMRYSDVQVVMASSLLPEQSVHGPTTVDINLDPTLFEEVEQLDDV
jgi:hypothetical protein